MQLMLVYQLLIESRRPIVWSISDLHKEQQSYVEQHSPH